MQVKPDFLDTTDSVMPMPLSCLFSKPINWTVETFNRKMEEKIELEVPPPQTSHGHLQDMECIIGISVDVFPFSDRQVYQSVYKKGSGC